MKASDKDAADKAAEAPKVIDADYVPIDFAAYTIPDRQTKASAQDEAQKLAKGDKIWRISSLTASIDDETKILILPQPESKRPVKIIDTTYTLDTYGDLVNAEKDAMDRLQIEKEVVKRYADKTKEELDQEQQRKRKAQLNKLTKIRVYQMGFFASALFGYFYVYRRFLMPKKVYQSHSYVQACDYLTGHKMVQQMLGKDIHVMMCNGKQYPYRNDFDFELILFGTGQNAKAKIHVSYN